MRAFLSAVAALVLVSVCASFALQQAGFSAAEVYKSDAVRLSD